MPKGSKLTGGLGAVDVGLGAVDVEITTTISVREIGVAHEDRNTIIVNRVYSLFMNYHFLFRA
jgi:hypothetical protein